MEKYVTEVNFQIKFQKFYSSSEKIVTLEPNSRFREKFSHDFTAFSIADVFHKLKNFIYYLRIYYLFVIIALFSFSLFSF